MTSGLSLLFAVVVCLDIEVGPSQLKTRFHAGSYRLWPLLPSGSETPSPLL